MKQELYHLMSQCETLVKCLERLDVDLTERGLPTEGIEAAEMIYVERHKLLQEMDDIIKNKLVLLTLEAKLEQQFSQAFNPFKIGEKYTDGKKIIRVDRTEAVFLIDRDEYVDFVAHGRRYYRNGQPGLLVDSLYWSDVERAENESRYL